MAKHLSAVVGEDGVRIMGIANWRDWVFDVSWDLRTVTVTAPPGEVITRETWRALPTGTVLKIARMEGGMAAMVGFDIAGDQPSTAQHLAAVAATYRFAISQGVPPRQAIRDHFEGRSEGGRVSYRTVDRWLASARRRGLLGSYAEERAEHELTPERWAERKRAEGVTSPLKPDEAKALAARVRRRVGLDSVEDEG